MIAFLGLSHLGILYSLATAARGFEVLGCDPDEEGVSRLSAGHFPVREPGLPELFAENRGRVRYTSDLPALSGCDPVFVSLDVPTDEDDRSDLGPLRRLVEAARPHLAPSSSLVVLSQVRPGFTRELAGAVPGCRVFYQVETLVFGAAVERALRPERYIVGSDRPREGLPAPYRRWLDAPGCPVLAMGYESAEVAKLAINLLLVSTVSTTNALAELCESIGADWSEIVPALRLDRRIGPHAYLSPGLGIAGGNLERDLATVKGLAGERGTDARLVGAWQQNSAYRKAWALRLLHREVLPSCPEPRIAVLGIAYKPDTASTKHSASLELLEGLRGLPVTAYDPVARLDPAAFPHVRFCASALDAVEGTDAVALMTPWKEFADLDPASVRERMRGRFVLDPFGAWDREACLGMGLRYYRLGAAGPAVGE